MMSIRVEFCSGRGYESHFCRSGPGLVASSTTEESGTTTNETNLTNDRLDEVSLQSTPTASTPFVSFVKFVVVKLLGGCACLYGCHDLAHLRPWLLEQHRQQATFA